MARWSSARPSGKGHLKDRQRPKVNIRLMYIERYFKTDLGFITGDPGDPAKLKAEGFILHKGRSRSHIQVS